MKINKEYMAVMRLGKAQMIFWNKIKKGVKIAYTKKGN